jgi:hypothetical protein
MVFASARPTLAPAPICLDDRLAEGVKERRIIRLNQPPSLFETEQTGKSAAGTDLIPTLQRVAGITANEKTIKCPHCKVMQKIHVAARTGFAARTVSAQTERQYISCLNCATEFEVSVRNKIVAGPFTP